jgi:hypothetical protein
MSIHSFPDRATFLRKLNCRPSAGTIYAGTGKIVNEVQALQTGRLRCNAMSLVQSATPAAIWLLPHFSSFFEARVWWLSVP